MEVYGRLQGLNATDLKALRRFYRRRIPPERPIYPQVAQSLAQWSHQLQKKIALLVNRKGEIRYVVIGDAQRIYLPDIGRQRAGRRLRGLRFIVTHLQPLQKPSRDELTDLIKLRLDFVLAFQVKSDGHAGSGALAHLVALHERRLEAQIQTFAHVSELNWNFQTWIREQEEALEKALKVPIEVQGQKALLVHVHQGERDAQARLKEMVELCKSCNLHLVQTIEQRRHKIDPKFVVGSGKLEEIELQCLDLGADTLIFSRDLTPAQSRAISNRSQLKVLDRTQIILDIFAQRATSHDGKLQVELAQLKYALPKLIQKNQAMSRLTGGIGGRGPGETKLEINRRRARDRIHRLEKQLQKLSKQRHLRRKKRRQKALPIISLVGYTNAGKSTLLNTLTHSKVCSEDKLFATLDPSSRRLRFPKDREVILTDTVGFIRDLPKDLIAAFKATLEELYESDILLHVVDISDPHFELHIQAVRKILKDLDLHQKPEILVLNKVDLLHSEKLEEILNVLDGIPISALKTSTTQHLLQVIEERLDLQ